MTMTGSRECSPACANGTLWARQEDHRGDPLFNQVRIRRQRECLLGQLCQGRARAGHAKPTDSRAMVSAAEAPRSGSPSRRHRV